MPKDMPSQPQSLAQTVKSHLDHYILEHKGELPPKGLYKRVISEIEKPLISCILNAVGGNKGKAAEILGMNRNTLRCKMKELKLE